MIAFKCPKIICVNGVTSENGVFVVEDGKISAVGNEAEIIILYNADIVISERNPFKLTTYVCKAVINGKFLINTVCNFRLMILRSFYLLQMYVLFHCVHKFSVEF